MSPAQPIKFYDILPAPGGCPFAQRAWLALEEKGLPYEHILIDPQNKPANFTALYQEITQDTTASGKVPIIIDGAFKLTESMPVVEYLDAAYADQGTQLVPRSAVELGKVKLFLELFGSKFTPGMFKLLRADSKQAVEDIKQELTESLKVLDNYIARQGSTEGGNYFLGGNYSIAETGTSSFVKRALVALPKFRDYDIVETAKAHGLDRLVSWIEASMSRESLVKVGPPDNIILEGLGKFVADIKS